MSDEATETVTGAVLEGSDGSVYFVPDVILQKYKVDDASAETARTEFGSAEVSGFDFSQSMAVGAPVQILRGQWGAFGAVTPGTTFAGDNDKTVVLTPASMQPGMAAGRRGPGPVIG